MEWITENKLIIEIIMVAIGLGSFLTAVISHFSGKIENRFNSLENRLDKHDHRIDRLYEMFVDLLKEKK